MDAAETPPAGAVVAVLTRAPGAGGKSRLFSALGAPPDPALPLALLLDTLDAIASPAWSIHVFVEPADSCDELRALLPLTIPVTPQRGGDLGERMRAAMDDCFAAGAAAVALVGSDLPEVDARAVQDAFDALRDDADLVVLGPARDGGYYLIAATCTPDLFSAIEWGSARVLTDTVEAARRGGIPVRIVAAADDVDGVEDLRRLARIDEQERADAPAPRTRTWLRGSGVMARLK